MSDLPLELKVDPKNEKLILKLSQLDKYDFSAINSDMQKKYSWPIEKSKYIEPRVKKFFALSFLNADNYHIPDIDVDEYWHRMILHTVWYHKFCSDMFGSYYHHTPAPDPNHISTENREKSKELMAYWFGEPWDFIVMTCTQCNHPTPGGFALELRPDPSTLPKL